MKKLFPEFSFNRVLSIILLVSITFSIVTVVSALTPNPGHDFTNVDGGVATGDILYGSGTDALSALAGVATGNALISGGVLTAPLWGKIALTTHVSGTLPVANGGTGVGTLTGLALGAGTGNFAAYGGTSCTNQFPRSLNASGAATCASVAAATDVSGTLPVTNGGTGLAASVSDAVLVGDSTSAYTARALPASCAGTTAKLLYDSTTNLFSCGTDQTSGGGATYVVTTGDVASTASTAYQNITNLSWAVAASTRYEVECDILYAASATTIGIGIGWTGPASPLLTSGMMVAGLTTATVGGTTIVGNDTGAVTTASVATTNNHARFNGFWSNGTTAGTLQMRFKPETATANGIIIKAGSWCKYVTY